MVTRSSVSTWMYEHRHLDKDNISATHQYSPPDVGIALPRSAMAKPTKKMNMLARNQPQTMPTGPAGME